MTLEKEKDDDILQEVAVGIVLFKFDEKNKPLFLLVQSSSESAHWLPPKGHKEKGETDHETAYREVEEECGFVNEKDYIIYPDFKQSLKYLANGKPKKSTYFLGKMIKDLTVVLSDEHQNFKWANYKDALLLLKHDISKNLIHEAVECIEFKQQNDLI